MNSLQLAGLLRFREELARSSPKSPRPRHRLAEARVMPFLAPRHGARALRRCSRWSPWPATATPGRRAAPLPSRGRRLVGGRGSRRRCPPTRRSQRRSGRARARAGSASGSASSPGRPLDRRSSPDPGVAPDSGPRSALDAGWAPGHSSSPVSVTQGRVISSWCASARQVGS